MRIVYVGNHGSAVGLGAEVGNGAHATTEAHWAAALELLGHDVVRVEEETTPWEERVAAAEGCDLFLWTSTWGFAEKWGPASAFEWVSYLNARVPTAAVHLDRWWGLSNRERQINESAMFKVGWVFTADGDHDEEWVDAGVNHRWLPPGVHEPECVPGVARDEWRSDVAFIGGHSDYGHAEHWPYRKAMLDVLRSAFGDRLGLWPKVGEPGPWGAGYNDLLASVKVVVGDSWQGASRYWSNRVFEVIGRGGFCVHPAVPGLVDMLPEGMGVGYFPPGDWGAMVDVIDRWVDGDAGRGDAVNFGQQYVREHHSYTARMRSMIGTMTDDGAWA